MSELPEWIKVGEPVAILWSATAAPDVGTVMRLTATMIIVARTDQPALRFRRDAPYREVGNGSRSGWGTPAKIIDPRGKEARDRFNRAEVDHTLTAIDHLKVRDPMALMATITELADTAHERITRRIAGEFVPVPGRH